MARRIGLGKGKGKGYKNLQGKDPRVHSDSARGRKQPQKLKAGMFVVGKRINVRGQVTSLNPFAVKIFRTDGKVIRHRLSNQKFWDRDIDGDGVPDKTDCDPDDPTRQDKDLKKSDLAQFTGSMEYHKWSILYPKFALTDGAFHVAEKGGAYWLMDIVGSYQTKEKFKFEEFQVWKLKKTNDNKAVVVAEDGDGNELVTQKIPYTDFFDKYDGDEISLYFTHGIILLPSEY